MIRTTHTAFAVARLALTVVVLFASTVFSHAQTVDRRLSGLLPEITGTEVVNPAERLQLAVASGRYPVTPGDVYRLTYLHSGEPVATELTVENDYTINLGLFGRLNARDTTFAELKPRIIQTVGNALPRSLPAVSMTSVGVFRIRILGSIAQSRSVTAWGLSRLSDVVRDNLSSYSSIRNITVVSSTGRRTNYDLFRALEAGVETQDPLIRPGDTVTIARADRVVYVGGEVNQSGRVELAPADSLSDLLAYARGTTIQADPSRVRINRTEDGTVRTHFVDLAAHGRFRLIDGDIVTILPRVRERPIVYVDGLVILPTADDPETLAMSPAARYDRIIVPIGIGETLYGVLDRVSDRISPRGHLAGARLIRDGVPVDLPSTIEQLLYNYRSELDVELNAFDRIVIPEDPRLSVEFERSVLEPEEFVLITGAVNAPGRYPYRPDMGAYAHIRLAGGFSRELNVNERFRVYDVAGNLKDPSDPIKPEDHIEVLRNSFVYNFNRHFPILATSIGFIATIIATIALFAP